ncbi:MAG: TlpA family protein disulfide reductase [Hyphomonas sp.]|nr:TlpA family protein disulfide reductase [Hyphomonas sp.]
MIRAFLATLALASAACACSPAPSESPISTPAATILPPDATGFITANPLPLGEDWKADVRRDDYGRPFEYALLGEHLPAFTGTLMDGTPFDSTQISRWTVIDLWGIWCGDCMADAPYVAALSTAIDQDPDLDFLSIHTPASAARTTPAEMFGKYGSLEAYFAGKGYAYPTLTDTDASIREALKIAWTPSYLLVSPEGIVKGYRSEFSAARGEPVKDFLKDIARVKSESKKTELDAPLLGPGGARGIGPGTPFTLDIVQAAFGGYDIVTTRVEAAGDMVPAFEVRREGEALLTLTPDWTLGRIERVSSTSPALAGPRGEHIGSARLSDFPDIDPANCTSGAAEAPDTLICPDPADIGFLRTFRPAAPGAAPDLLVSIAYEYPFVPLGE